MQRELFDADLNYAEPISLEEVFDAYFTCRKHKQNTPSALAFETDYEAGLVKLWREINTGAYRPGRSEAFIVNQPVKREIFAAGFRDRIVHHLIVNKLNPLFEKEFIYDSFACRVGKGTGFGIRRAERFIRECSKNYTVECYALKLDVSGFFMSLNRGLLYRKLKKFIYEKYRAGDRDRLLSLCRVVIFSDPVKNCRIKGDPRDWEGLPVNKSLFHASAGYGLPIGNLTSQVFANLYMNRFDHYVKSVLRLRYYGRYVDDMIFVHRDKERLKELVPLIRRYLKQELKLTLHGKKIYLQHYGKGFAFLGVYIKPGRIYTGRRTKRNFRLAVEKQNAVVVNHKPNPVHRRRFLSVVNSYLGLMNPYDTHTLRKAFWGSRVHDLWHRRFVPDSGTRKVVLKR